MYRRSAAFRRQENVKATLNRGERAVTVTESERVTFAQFLITMCTIRHQLPTMLILNETKCYGVDEK